MTSEIQIIPVTGLPEVVEGDDLGALIAQAVRSASLEVCDRDLFVVAQKIVSKAEGRVVRLDTVEPSEPARQWASEHDKDARVIEVVLRESARLVKMERGVIISETHHGFVCANAGVDASNVAKGSVVLLPLDPDRSARRLRRDLEKSFGVRLAVIVSDTFGRPWREGLVNVALGVSGLRPLIDYRGQLDSHGQLLRVTVIAAADEIASAAELVMKKSSGVAVAVVRGLDYEAGEGGGGELVRAPERDLFR